jgi:hypothetical protein
MWQKGDNG